MKVIWNVLWVDGKWKDERVPVFRLFSRPSLICDVWCTACSAEWCVIRWATTELSKCIDEQKAQRAELLRVTEEAPLLLYGQARPRWESSTPNPRHPFDHYLPRLLTTYPHFAKYLPSLLYSLMAIGHDPLWDVVLNVLSCHLCNVPPWQVLTFKHLPNYKCLKFYLILSS